MKIPIRPPTLKDIQNENEIYSAYLVGGGEPLRIILELVPTPVGFDWRMSARMPDKLPPLPYCMMFTTYASERVSEALKPPTDEPDTNTKTS